MKKQFPEIPLIELSENTGYTEGYNRALKKIDSTYYLLLNSDIEVSPNWIEPLLEVMQSDYKVAACQPKVLSYKNKAIFEYAGAAGGWMDTLGYPFCRGRLFDICEKDEEQYDELQEIAWASGAAMLIQSELFHGVGGFDSDYFAHQEEIDLCWRLRRAGYKIICQPKSTVYHLGGGTLQYESPFKTYLNFRNNLMTIFKNESREKLTWLIILRLMLDGVAGMVFLLKGKFSHTGAIIQAHWSFFPKLMYLRKRRKLFYRHIYKISIGEPNKNGIYKGSIVWNYFIKRKKTFKDLF